MTKRFNYYFDITSFRVGIEITKTQPVSGWRWYIAVDIGFVSLWVYFGRVKRNHK